MLLATLLVQMALAEDLRATTSDGRAVILSEDGTWQFDSESEGQQITIAEYSHEVVPENAQARRYSTKLKMQFTFRNDYDRPIAAWKGEIQFRDLFGELVVSSPYSYGKGTMAPAETSRISLEYEDNQFIDTDGFSKLAPYEPDKLKVTLVNVEVVFAQ